MALTRWTFTRSHLLPLLAAVGLLGLFSGVCQSGGRQAPPVNLITGVEPEVGEMDPRLAKALNAFGFSRYDECRRLAQALISASSDASTRAECVGLIILSHLHQGDFDTARQAAENLRSVSPDVCQDLLPRVNREERDYQAEVTRLQRIVATTKDPEEAARAQLRTAHMHHLYGRLGLAEPSYRKVVQRYPTSPLAARAATRMVGIAVGRGDLDGAEAVLTQAINKLPPLLQRVDAANRLAVIEMRRGRFEAAEQTWWRILEDSPGSPQAGDAIIGITALRRHLGDPDGAIAACEKVIELAPDAPAGIRACELIVDISVPQPRNSPTPKGRRRNSPSTTAQPPGYQAAIARLSRIATDHPGTAAAAPAKRALASMHQREGLRLWQARSYLAAAQELEKALAQGTLGAPGMITALHTIGLCYDATEQMHKAIPPLAQALELATDTKQQFDIGWALGTCHYKLGDYPEGHGLFRFIAKLEVVQERKEMAEEMAAECEMQAEAAGRPFTP